MHTYNIITLYICVYVRAYIVPHKNIVLKKVKTLAISKYCRIFAAQTNNNNNKNLYSMETSKTNESANVKATNVQVDNANVQATNVQVTDPAADQNKVTAKAAIKSISKVAAFVRTERKGANATIRILMDAAQNGDADAINTLCALCDVPTDMAHAITLEDVRHAVNTYYPYVAMTEAGRKINVRAKSVHYSTAASDDKTQDDAKKRVVKGYYVEEITDYLTALTQAARARAKGQQQIIVDAAKVYEDNKLTTLADVTVEDVTDAKTRGFDATKVNVWRHSSIFGYYI